MCLEQTFWLLSDEVRGALNGRGGRPECIGSAEWRVVTSTEPAWAERGTGSESHAGCVLAH